MIDNKVTDVGLRLAVAQYLPDELELRIDNLAKNKARVYLKGKEKTVNEFYEFLKKQPLGDAQGYRFTSLQAASAQVDVNSERFFHKLQSEQLGKFVSAGLRMGDDINGMGKVVGGLDSKYHTISTTLSAQLLVSVLMLLAMLFALFFVLK